MRRGYRSILIPGSGSGGGAPVGSAYVTIGNDGTLTNERALTGTANQITVTDNGAGSTVVLSLDATLAALGAYNTDGLLTQTAADTFTGRTITGTANQVVVTNGSGVAGNPTLSTPQDIATGSSPTFAGLTLSGLTAKSLVFAGVGGVLSQNNADLYWDNSTYALKIGEATIATAGSLHLWGTRITNYRLTANQTGPGLSTYKGRISGSSPRRTISGDSIGVCNAFGYTAIDNSTDAVISTGQGKGIFAFVADEDFTTTGQGTYFLISTTPVGATTAVERFRVTSDGRIYGGALHNNAGAVTGTTTQYIASGSYTPTLTNVANVAASTAYQAQWIRVGNVVTVSGKVDVDPTASATLTQLGLSLPIASNIGAAEDCSGTAHASAIASQGAAILGDATNDRAQMDWIAGDVTNQPMYYTYTYEVL